MKIEFREKPLGTVVVVNEVEYFSREHVVAMISGAMRDYSNKPSVLAAAETRVRTQFPVRKFSVATVYEIRTRAQKENLQALADEYQTTYDTIYRIVYRITYKDLK